MLVASQLHIGRFNKQTKTVHDDTHSTPRTAAHCANVLESVTFLFQWDAPRIKIDARVFLQFIHHADKQPQKCFHITGLNTPCAKPLKRRAGLIVLETGQRRVLEVAAWKHRRLRISEDHQTGLKAPCVSAVFRVLPKSHCMVSDLLDPITDG